jgi:hypothetical protein
LCIKDTKQGYEGIYLELTLTFVFASIGETRSITIIINKLKTSLNVIHKVIEMGAHCWSIQSGKRVMVAKRILIYHFHVMKAWNKNIFTRISILNKDRI